EATAWIDGHGDAHRPTPVGKLQARADRRLARAARRLERASLRLVERPRGRGRRRRRVELDAPRAPGRGGPFEGEGGGEERHDGARLRAPLVYRRRLRVGRVADALQRAGQAREPL